MRRPITNYTKVQNFSVIHDSDVIRSRSETTRAKHFPELTGLEKMTTVRHRKRKTKTNEVNAALVWGGISQSESARQRETELDVSVCVCQYVCERNWGEATFIMLQRECSPERRLTPNRRNCLQNSHCVQKKKKKREEKMTNGRKKRSLLQCVSHPRSQ